MKMNLLVLAASGFALTVCNSQAGDLGSPAPTPSAIDPATRLVVAFTANRWTTDKLVIATGRLTNTNAVPVTVTRIIVTGFDKPRNVVAGGPFYLGFSWQFQFVRFLRGPSSAVQVA